MISDHHTNNKKLNTMHNAKNRDNTDYETIFLNKKIITPEDVMKIRMPTRNYLCPMEANVFGIDFTRFQIREIPSNRVIFQINKSFWREHEFSKDASLLLPNGSGTIILLISLSSFSKSFIIHLVSCNDELNIYKIVEFTVGNHEIQDFRMIEHHFFRDTLIKSFDFDFGFCIPNTVNTCEHIYEMPKMTHHQIRDMVKNPYETKSDSYYFVNGNLFMHNKAEYAFDLDT
ncbi:protein unc-119 homolog B-A-like isoform X2 [Gordionus sp. m RMFG-2023]|uniref:protein unc-119 homolog B-A-like isoform X2 n=1 Tax=Gordionus sp. m RMFG-2023 TaxID=3053472 RepID=UPI0031FCAE8D